jgi:hypothetical protein
MFTFEIDSEIALVVCTLGTLGQPVGVELFKELLQIQTEPFGEPPTPSASHLTLALDQY